MPANASVLETRSAAWRFTSPRACSTQAGGGEVIVSSTVKDLTVGSNLEMASLGARSLKGVPGEWSLFRVVSA